MSGRITKRLLVFQGLEPTGDGGEETHARQLEQAAAAKVAHQQNPPQAQAAGLPSPTPGSSRWLKQQGLVTESGSGALVPAVGTLTCTTMG